MDHTLRDGKVVYTMPAEQFEMRRESGFPLHCSSVGKIICRKKGNLFLFSFLSTSPAITHVGSSAKEGPGKREIGLSLQKQLNYV